MEDGGDFSFLAPSSSSSSSPVSATERASAAVRLSSSCLLGGRWWGDTFHNISRFKVQGSREGERKERKEILYAHQGKNITNFGATELSRRSITSNTFLAVLIFRTYLESL